MRTPIKVCIVGGVMLTSALAFADVARSSTGEGDIQTVAIAAAKASAQRDYGNDITSWGEKSSSSKTIHPNQYDQSVTATQWTCQVDFTTKK